MLLGALLIVAALALAACGDDDDDDGGGGTGNIEAQSVIRFAFAPDPVWNYIVDSGILEEKGTEAGIDINAFQSFDEFGLFAGGNADVLSTGSYETPLLDEQGIETVTFGKYNANKDIFAVAADDPAKTAKDLDEGCKVAAESTTGNTVIWASLINRLDGRTLEGGRRPRAGHGRLPDHAAAARGRRDLRRDHRSVPGDGAAPGTTRSRALRRPARQRVVRGGGALQA